MTPKHYIDVPECLQTKTIYEILAHFCKICVAIYAFITGWVYCHHKNKKLSYSFKKIAHLLSNYWFVLLLFTVFGCFLCDYILSTSFIFSELIPISDTQLIPSSWYVFFYMILIIILPFFAFIERKTNIIFSFVAIYILHFSLFYTGIYESSIWLVYAALGYAVAKYNLLERTISIIPQNVFFAILAIILCALSIGAWAILYVMRSVVLGDIPVFVLIACLLFLHSFIRNTWIDNVICFFGKHSMNIWFIHLIFFSSITRSVIQPIFFQSTNPLYIFLCVLATSLLISIIITPIERLITQRIVLPCLGYRSKEETSGSTDKCPPCTTKVQDTREEKS